MSKQMFIAAFLGFGLFLFIAATQQPTVRVVNSYELEIGGTFVDLPPNMMAYKQTDGKISIRFMSGNTCNKDTEKMIGIGYAGEPICAPEGTSK